MPKCFDCQCEIPDGDHVCHACLELEMAAYRLYLAEAAKRRTCSQALALADARLEQQIDSRKEITTPTLLEQRRKGPTK